jgi:hypothetical protein
MRAVALDRFGGPEVLMLRTVPLPDVGPQEVLIRVQVTGLLKYERRPLQQIIADLYAARGDLFDDLFSRAWALLDGQKTIESRVSVNRSAPFDRVQAEDIVFFKLSGGPILGVGIVDYAQFYRITPDTLHQIRHQFADALCITDAAFWDTHAQASFALLLHLRRVARIEPTPFYKRDRRGWVVLHPRTEQQALWYDDAEDAGSATPLSDDRDNRSA